MLIFIHPSYFSVQKNFSSNNQTTGLWKDKDKSANDPSDPSGWRFSLVSVV